MRPNRVVIGAEERAGRRHPEATSTGRSTSSRRRLSSPSVETVGADQVRLQRFPRDEDHRSSTRWPILLREGRRRRQPGGQGDGARPAGSARSSSTPARRFGGVLLPQGHARAW
ncbi:MAG: hypothetical protein MZU95_09810 [Desulfomicrobium escambiense]|nr:hypothetical protein [Desulfomicrobium escambiense]